MFAWRAGHFGAVASLTALCRGRFCRLAGQQSWIGGDSNAQWRHSPNGDEFIRSPLCTTSICRISPSENVLKLRQLELLSLQDRQVHFSRMKLRSPRTPRKGLSMFSRRQVLLGTAGAVVTMSLTARAQVTEHQVRCSTRARKV